jgi:hypothetical protein
MKPDAVQRIAEDQKVFSFGIVEGFYSEVVARAKKGLSREELALNRTR